jgi:hypothetical protein
VGGIGCGKDGVPKRERNLRDDQDEQRGREIRDRGEDGPGQIQSQFHLSQIRQYLSYRKRDDDPE